MTRSLSMGAATALRVDPEDGVVTCAIRALTTSAELIASYRLRYRVYVGLGYVSGFHRAKLEIDAYDRFAIPFGAFDVTSGAMIGTLRLLTNEEQPAYSRAIDRVISTSGDEVLRAACSVRPHRLPSLVSEPIRRELARFNRDGLPVEELSRTIVDPASRGLGVSRGLMELGLAYASRRGPVVLVGGCLSRHVGMYRKYGYEKLPGTGPERYDSVGQIADAVACRTDILPEPTRSHVAELSAHLRSGTRNCQLDIASGRRADYQLCAPGDISRLELK
jgi:hypothetical protein